MHQSILPCGRPKPGHKPETGYDSCYVQVPYHGTEIDPPVTRARQAIQFTPNELTAYNTLTQNGSSVTPQLLGYTEGRQDSFGLVPGGFITSFAWSIVPGIRLGDMDGATNFRALEAEEQARIRAAVPASFT